MSTIIRPEVSEKNPYWIEKHRYYELKHFCLQYPFWKKTYISLNGLYGRKLNWTSFIASGVLGDPTAKNGIIQSWLSERINLIERAAVETDRTLSSYIIQAVTQGWSYDILKARLEIPCCKDKYYELYRKFFWILNRERG